MTKLSDDDKISFDEDYINSDIAPKEVVDVSSSKFITVTEYILPEDQSPLDTCVVELESKKAENETLDEPEQASLGSELHKKDKRKRSRSRRKHKIVEQPAATESSSERDPVTIQIETALPTDESKHNPEIVLSEHVTIISEDGSNNKNKEEESVKPEIIRKNKRSRSHRKTKDADDTTDLLLETTTTPQYITYATVAAMHAYKEDNAGDNKIEISKTKEPVQIRIQVVEDTHVEREPLPTTTDGFIEMLSRKDRRSRSRSRNKFDSQNQEEPTSAPEIKPDISVSEYYDPIAFEECVPATDIINRAQPSGASNKEKKKRSRSRQKQKSDSPSVYAEILNEDLQDKPAGECGLVRQEDPIRIKEIETPESEHTQMKVLVKMYTEDEPLLITSSESTSTTLEPSNQIELEEEKPFKKSKKHKSRSHNKHKTELEESTTAMVPHAESLITYANITATQKHPNIELVKCEREQRDAISSVSEVTEHLQQPVEPNKERTESPQRKEEEELTPRTSIEIKTNVSSQETEKDVPISINLESKPAKDETHTKKRKNKSPTENNVISSDKELLSDNVEPERSIKNDEYLVDVLLRPIEITDNSSTTITNDPTVLSNNLNEPEEVHQKRSGFFGNLLAKVTGSKHDSSKSKDKSQREEKTKRKHKKSKNDHSSSEGEEDRRERRHSGVLETLIAKVSDVLRKKSDAPVKHQEIAKHLKDDGPFWLDKYIYSDAEENYQLQLAKLNRLQPASENVRRSYDDSRDKDGDSDSSGDRSSPKPPKLDETRLASDINSRYTSVNLPGGICRWKGESTYLAPEEPISETLLKSEDPKTYENVSSLTDQTKPADLISDNDFIVTQYTSTPTLGPTIHTISSAPVEEVTSPDFESNDDYLYKKSIAEDVKNLGSALQGTEISASKLPVEDCRTILLALMNVTGDLKKHATEAIRLENLILQLPSDNDAQVLAAHLAGIRTRIATLLSQAENGTIAIEAAQKAQIKRQDQLTQYHLLLIEIESWLQTTRSTLSKETKPATVPEINNEIAACTALNNDLTTKENKLTELVSVCEDFKKYPDLKELSENLLEHLRTLILIFYEQRTIITDKVQILTTHLRKVQEDEKRSPYSSLQDSTLDSSSMPVEEIPVHADTKHFILSEKEPLGVSIETQTGQSLSSPSPVVLTELEAGQPIDVEIQTQPPVVEKERIKFRKPSSGIKKLFISRRNRSRVS
ncbi:hypothetical protein FQR65_LT06175 [Abscondita terminalis]|nr:hypothetical protein FQR65_LT06175 [Abscondita terminalis]